jgi:hypothetical protein
LSNALRDPQGQVRRLAIRYAAEFNQVQLVPDLLGCLENDRVDTAEFYELVSAISFLRSGNASPRKRDPARDKLLLEIFQDPSRPMRLRHLALSQLPSDATELNDQQLLTLLPSSDPQLRRQLLSILASRRQASTVSQLESLLMDTGQSEPLRCDTLAALARDASWYRQPNMVDRLNELRSNQVSAAPQLAVELDRILALATGQIDASRKPPRDDIATWERLIQGKGDVQRGWRVWVRSQCAQCHLVDGRGADVGPDLSSLGNDRRRTLQSILEPSRDVAPLYATWQVITTDGRSLTGAKLNGGGVGTNLKYLAADGSTFEVALADIESQQMSPRSVMPDDLVDRLSLVELADLIEFLHDR